MDQLSYFQILKVNVFTLFDYSTMGSEMIQVQKQNFAQNILIQMKEAKKNIVKTRQEIERVNRILAVLPGATPRSRNADLPAIYSQPQSYRSVFSGIASKTDEDDKDKEPGQI